MIGKITKGARAGAIGAYLHGAGRANEHSYEARGSTHAGGIVIGSNLPHVVGDTDPKRWAAEMRKPLAMRERAVKQPIWQVSLALPPGEKLSQEQWADAAQTFVEKLGVAEHPWVAVHHGPSGGGNDHIHIVLNRVDYAGTLWAAKNDFRVVQRVCTELEAQYGLTKAPRTRTTDAPKRATKQEIRQTRQKRSEGIKQVRRVASLYRNAIGAPKGAQRPAQRQGVQQLERDAAALRARAQGQTQPTQRGDDLTR